MTHTELKHARTLIRWTAKEAARQFSVPLRTYYNFEKGITPVPDRIAWFLEKKLEIDLKYIEPTLTPDHLYAFRRMFDLSQDQAAALCGVSRVSWNRYEKEKSPIPRHLRQTIKEVVKQLKEVEK